MAISYADIQKAADKKLEDFVVTVPVPADAPIAAGEPSTEELRFNHLMRVDKDVRTAYADLFRPTTYKAAKFKNMDGIDVQVFVIKNIFELLAKTPNDFERLAATVTASCEAREVAELTDWKELLASYGSEVEEGEA